MAQLQHESQASWSLNWPKNGFYLNNNDASEEIDKQRILHEWSFHMKFIKRAFGEFDKFHMK